MPPPPSQWTLRAKLLASVLALFTVVMLATSALTVLETQRYLTQGIERDLNGALGRVGDSRPGGYDGDDDNRLPPRGGPVAAPGGGNMLVLLLNPDGTVYTDRQGVQQNAVVNDTGANDRLDTAQVRKVSESVDGADTVRVVVGGDVGSYLVDRAHGVGRSAPHRGRVHPPGRRADGQAARPRRGRHRHRARARRRRRHGRHPAQPRARSTGWRPRPGASPTSSSTRARSRSPSGCRPRMPTHTPRSARSAWPSTRCSTTSESALLARQASETQVRQFVADASHELRTPLASIRGYAELTRRETEPVPPTVTHAIGRVESEALRMQELVEDLLLLARLDSGRPLAREPVDLSLLAVNAVSDAHAASPDHTWELDLPEDPVEVPGDQARLHQILANLLANARTHTPAGTRVVTQVRPEGPLVRVSVTDDGPGVPEGLQPKIFERFTRGDDARVRANGSTGLGLSIVAAVGHAHGGRVEVSSRPGSTRFSVLLPAT